jgi:hypothetical protein
MMADCRRIAAHGPLDSPAARSGGGLTAEPERKPGFVPRGFETLPVTVA